MGSSPLLMSAEHPFMRSYIRNTHIKNNCMGANVTLNGVKWIMHGLHLRKVVKEVVRTCAICAVTRAPPYHYPEQPELPLEIMLAQKPFNATGVDLCGPFEMRQGHSGAS